MTEAMTQTVTRTTKAVSGLGGADLDGDEGGLVLSNCNCFSCPYLFTDLSNVFLVF